MARDTPMLWVRNQVLPESGISATLMKALMNEACSEPSRRSHAMASPIPAPAATPLTAATVGTGTSTSARITGLKRSRITPARLGDPAS